MVVLTQDVLQYKRTISVSSLMPSHAGSRVYVVDAAYEQDCATISLLFTMPSERFEETSVGGVKQWRLVCVS